ncbi:MAG: PEP-CTERM sorting domain-containing protein [Planctomycetaceae bacterium]
MNVVRPLCAIVCFVVGAVPAAATTVLVSADLQGLNYPGQLTQTGWQVAEVAPAGSAGSQSLPLSASGSAAGITATLVTTGSWFGRGGPDSSRGYVAGTSFDGVVSDLWFTRDTMSFTLQLAGLLSGTSYTVRAWHNDSYTINEGAAAGGGTVHPSLSSGTVLASTDGTVSNLYGTRTNANFGVTSMSFQPASSTAVVTFTRNGGSFNGVPLSGVELTTVAAVPEPTTLGMVAGGIACVAWQAGRRRRSVTAMHNAAGSFKALG